MYISEPQTASFCYRHHGRQDVDTASKLPPGGCRMEQIIYAARLWFISSSV